VNPLAIRASTMTRTVMTPERCGNGY